ncbi:MAG: SPOR domain-containing protein [Bacteroidales bacterium]|nr:SPOR domain-containing protein [Bacteroidales bacterium]
MNITDLIVDFIKEGNVVEFPGMGTLSSCTIDAHHDQATGTYYPTRRSVEMNNTISGNRAIISRIAEKECVSPEIAEQVWSNFVGALEDKLKRTPSGHEFSGIGTMRRVGNRVVFDAIEGLDLDADKHHEQPLENIATYTPKNTVDPFAAFEKPTPEPEPAPVPEPEPMPEPKPEPVHEPTPEPEPEPIVVPEPEQKPEPAEDQQPNNAFAAATAAAATAAAATTIAAAANADHLSEVKRMLDEIPSSPKDAKELRRAEKAAAKAEKAARKAAEEAQKAAAKEAKEAAKEAAKAAKNAEKAAAKASAQPEVKPVESMAQPQKETKKKKKHTWLWIILVLLLLAGGGAYYYFFYNADGNTTSGENCASDVKVDYRDDFVDMFHMLKYSEIDIHNSGVHVHNFMAEYIHNFLLARHYSNAFVPIMSMVDDYANERLNELMVEGYCPHRFFPYDYMWMNRNYKEYKRCGAYKHECTVQGELMDVEFLEDMLDRVVTNLGLRADGYGLTGQTAAPKAAPKNDKPYVESVPEAPTFRNSKQGYDIVAGFFTNKTSANKCANQLKALGSDAYVINKAGGYYVSMGSAPTMTAAQAMEKHIKSWYKSDVKIYNFNE